MAEIKGLQDFYNPTQAINAYVGMQQVALHQQQIANQNQNMAIDNARQGFLTAVKENPLAAVSAWNAFAKPSGLQEINNPSAFLANPQPYLDLARHDPGTPEHQAASQAIAGMGASQSAASQKEAERRMLLGGGKQLAQAVGAGGSAEAATAVLNSPQGQAEAYKAMVAQAQQAGANAQLTGLVPVNSQAQRGLSNLQPHTESLSNLMQQQQQWTAKYGAPEAKRKFDEAVKLNPELVKYQQQAQASVPQIEQQLQELRQKSDSLNNDRILMATGAKPSGPEVSPYVMTHQLQAAGFHERLLQAQLELAKDPMNIQKHAEVARASLDLNSHVQGLVNSAITPEQVKTETTNATNMGQQQFAALPTDQQNPQQAARIARQVQAQTGKIISTEDVMKGVKLPNQPLIQQTFGEEKQESKTVGAGFGEQYLESQKAGRNAISKIGKLDRMESLLTGMTTGKLTPAITQIQALADAFGVQIDKTLGAKQALIALSNEIALDFRNPSGGAGMPGNLSNYDLQFLRSMPPDLAKTPEGNRLIIDTARQIAKRDQVTAKMARDYRKKHGHVDEGFYDEMAAYAEANPLFRDKTIPGTATTPPATSGRAYRDLPSGATYAAPDGTIRRKK